MQRTGLVVLQLLGAVSLVPYPAVLAANVMAVASPKGTVLTAIPYVVLSLYPLVWVALWAVSWGAMARGAAPLAFGLSSVPALASLAVAGTVAVGGLTLARAGERAAEEARRRIEPVNPLLWAVWRAAAATRHPSGQPVSVEPALAALEENPTLVNVAVPPYGTPLYVTVSSLSFRHDGTPQGNPGMQLDLVRLVRALHARGARLAPEEQLDLRRTWLLRLALHDGPITTAEENPLVWRLVTRRRDGVTLFELEEGEVPLLNRATRLHGTPLYAALLQEGFDAYPVLVNAGARLSDRETSDPAAAAALVRLFERFPELRRSYEQGG